MISFFSVLEWFEKRFDPDKNDEIDTRVLTRYLRPWGYLGLWPDNEGGNGKIRFYYPRCLLILCFFTLMVSIFKIYDGIRTLNSSSITEIVFIIFVSCKTLVKTATYILQPKQINQLCLDLEKLHDHHLRHGNQQVKLILRRAKLLSKFISTYMGNIISLMAVFCAVIFYVAMLFYRETALRGWYPCDISRSPCMEIVLTQEVITFFTEMQILSFSDSFLYDILSQTLAQFKIVNYNFQHIREYVVEGGRQEVSVSDGNTTNHTIVQVLSQSMQELGAETGRLTLEKRVEHKTHYPIDLSRLHDPRDPLTDVERSRLQVQGRGAIQGSLEVPHSYVDRSRMLSRRDVSRSRLQVQFGRASQEVPRRHVDRSRMQDGRDVSRSRMQVQFGRASQEVPRRHVDRSRMQGGRDVSRSRLQVQFGRASQEVPRRYVDRSGFHVQRGGACKNTLAVWREKRSETAIDRGMKLRLAECIRHHQEVIRLTTNIQNVYNTYFLYQILCNLLETATMALYITMGNSMGMKQVGILFLVVIVFSQLLLMCWFANQITEEALNVKDSIFGCDWLDTPQSFKLTMLTVMTRADTPVVIQAGGFVPLLMTTFHDVTNTSYSHFMAMRTATQEK